MTKEHVYPRWLRKIIGPVDLVETRLQIAEGSTKRSRSVVPFDRTVKSVCGRCNGGWMSRLETAAEPLLAPILHGDSVVLSPQHAITLSTWIYKTVLMVHEQGITEHSLIPHRHYTHLFHQRTPPREVRMWVAEIEEPLSGNEIAAYGFAERLEFMGQGDADMPTGTRFYEPQCPLGHSWRA